MSSLDKENGPFARLVQTRQPRVSIRNAKQFRPRAGSLEVKRRKCMFMDGTVEFENETRTGTTHFRQGISASLTDTEFERSVFVNCPFDQKYEHILQAILFCLIRFGLTPRLAKERSDAGEARIQKILELVRSSKYSIHDLSRSQARRAGEHYRLNMPFELGIDFGFRHYGGNPFSEKAILILVEQPYVYQAAISDLAGSDVESHHGKYQRAVRKVRNWLIGQNGFEKVGANRILSEVRGFSSVVFEATA